MAIPIIRFDGWTLNPQSGELGRGETRLRLPEQPLQILQALLERPGEVVPREQLIARLWPTGVVDFETGLNTAVRKLRIALGDMADTPRYIETLPRRGYRFIGRLDPTAAAAQPGRVAGPSETIAPAAFVGATSAAATTAEIPVRQDLRRIRLAWLAASLTCLALGGWYLARNFLLGGSRSMHASSAVASQTEIPDSVVGALERTVDNSATQIELGGTHNAAAMNAYLRGLRLSDATIKTAPEAHALLDAFDEALRLDPDFALAHAARSRALMDYGGHFTVDATRGAFARARADAERAIALAPASGESHAALGEVYEYGYLDFPHAALEYARAVELSPGNARVLRAFAEFAGNMGDFDKAISAARRNVALDPFNVPGHRALGEVLTDARQYTEAVAEFDEAIRLAPDRASEVYQKRGRALYLLGKYEAAAASCEAEPDRYEAQSCLPLIYEKLGRHAEAESMLATAVAEQGDFSAYQFMEINAQWGNISKALEWLDVAVRVQDPGLEYLKIDPLLDPLRSQARFRAVERALRFPG